MSKKKKKKKMPRYKRIMRLWIWKFSKALKLTDKVGRMNAWATGHPKKFFWMTVGILSLIVLSTIVSFIVNWHDYQTGISQMAIEDSTGMERIGDPMVQRNVNGLREIDNNKAVIREETKSLLDKGKQINRELDSLLKLQVKTPEDSDRILRDYKSLKTIVNFLDKGKK